jgi:hypothetical protein
MARKGYSAEQIIGKLREAEILLAKGQTVGQASHVLGITEQTTTAGAKNTVVSRFPRPSCSKSLSAKMPVCARR